MTAQIINLKLEQGANFSRVFDIVVDDPDTGDPISLTGFQGNMQARSEPGDELLVEFDVSIDVTGRRAIATFAAVDSELMTWSSGVYDLVISSGSDVYRIAEGNISLSKQVTIIDEGV
jgi:hypothetical protein